MPAKTEKELTESARALWLKAVAAIERRNLDYAISLLQGVLKEEPEFLGGRQLLRRTEIVKHKPGRRALFKSLASAIAIMKAKRESKNDPARAVALIERVLENEPYNRQANLVLKQAALAAGWPEVGVFALQTLLEEKARDTKILHELGRLYHDLGEAEREVEIYSRLVQIDPTDAEADRLDKAASARASMRSGGWSRAENQRDLIPGREPAVSPGQRDPLAPAGESLELQIEAALACQRAEPRNVDCARKLGALYVLKRDVENAIAWYQYAADLSDKSDGEGNRMQSGPGPRVDGREE